ncbi:hypothetical protein D9619_005325 [Psilocybe cf. subviscida]|uniref:Uncharacterized protein n=1 Tax=Psilocybe cf. subviscida TaxID=2480587 RepID=A0A8H5BWW2_9AGAR|nr:hypothetical protein D9619_005325 [Psilocybe cf. subviscida]
MSSLIEPSHVSFRLEQSLETPAHIASLAFGHAGHLFTGSDDGSLRVYDLSSYKVIKAIRGIGDEVSSIVCIKRPGSELRDAIVAHGQKVSRFQLESPKMIQTLEDALFTLTVGETDEDILNEYMRFSSATSALTFSIPALSCCHNCCKTTLPSLSS